MSRPRSVDSALCLFRFFLRNAEEFHERPHALFLSVGRKSLGSCKLSYAVEAAQKSSDRTSGLRALPSKQLQNLGKCESQLWRSSGLTERDAQAERKHRLIQCGRRCCELQICVRDRFDCASTLYLFPRLLHCQAKLLESFDRNCGENSLAASQNGRKEQVGYRKSRPIAAERSR